MHFNGGDRLGGLFMVFVYCTFSHEIPKHGSKADLPSTLPIKELVGDWKTDAPSNGVMPMLNRLVTCKSHKWQQNP